MNIELVFRCNPCLVLIEELNILIDSLKHLALHVVIKMPKTEGSTSHTSIRIVTCSVCQITSLEIVIGP